MSPPYQLDPRSSEAFWRFGHPGPGSFQWKVALLPAAVATLTAKLPLLAGPCILHHVLVHMPTSCPPITHTHCSYSMWKEQFSAGAGYDWALVCGTQLAKMARVTPRLGNGPTLWDLFCSFPQHKTDIFTSTFFLLLPCQCTYVPLRDFN